MIMGTWKTHLNFTCTSFSIPSKSKRFRDIKFSHHYLPKARIAAKHDKLIVFLTRKCIGPSSVLWSFQWQIEKCQKDKHLQTFFTTYSWRRYLIRPFHGTSFSQYVGSTQSYKISLSQFVKFAYIVREMSYKTVSWDNFF